jgi:transcriptional regulator with XRE-family HTH domain
MQIMGFDINKLNEIAVLRSEAAKQNAMNRRENREYIRMSQDIALCIHYYLRKSNMTQKEFADKMGVSPAYIGRLLKGGENLTLETICKVQNVLGQDLIRVTTPYVITQIISFHPMQTPQFTETVRSDRYVGVQTYNNNTSFTDNNSVA